MVYVWRSIASALPKQPFDTPEAAFRHPRSSLSTPSKVCFGKNKDSSRHNHLELPFIIIAVYDRSPKMRVPTRTSVEP